MSRDTQEEPKVRMVKPEPSLMEQEQGRVMQFELGREEVFLTEGHTQEEVDELKEQSLEVPEDFYGKKWTRYRFKLPENNIENEEESRKAPSIIDPQDIPE